MKQVIIIFTLFGLTLLSCKKSGSIDHIPTSLDGKWRMILVTENISGLTTTKTTNIQGDVDIIFTPTSSTNGTFTGNTPTNDIWQNDYSTGTNQSINIPCLSMTKVMETTWGKEFVDNIRSSYEYKFAADGKLNIKATNKILTFKKM
jgi:hypothetical protein